jgi:hypothetical protein
MRRFMVLAVIVAGTIGGVAPAVAAGSTARAPYCGIRWGSLEKTDPDMTSASITNVRAGRHACFDRLVIDLGPKVAGLFGPDESGFHVEYVDVVTQDGSGAPVPLAGGAFLQVVVRAPSFDANGNPTYHPANGRQLVNVRGFRTFRQVADAGSFEGQTTFGLGVRARLPFRVFLLAGPGAGSRVVIDVAHRW